MGSGRKDGKQASPPTSRPRPISPDLIGTSLVFARVRCAAKTSSATSVRARRILIGSRETAHLYSDLVWNGASRPPSVSDRIRDKVASAARGSHHANPARDLQHTAGGVNAIPAEQRWKCGRNQCDELAASAWHTRRSDMVCRRGRVARPGISLRDFLVAWGGQASWTTLASSLECVSLPRSRARLC